ncbi:hypothetical protein SELMODRAFT_138081 [Selaginella moellendorffii]|uniref:Uncharacterized protein n=1 Tax=Selaginella moellendorffii TaxID=88036 RepID=D8TEK8_SELML|nr:cytochrome P450 734A1 [Selaginella moellendorffii]EFJ04917.1 hypothetical protein SELMODRAFT_138081 [Selaginella moellendorffii]|eukprot:XP_002994035.1 cytochrome P450 734A1 [Selaginella moellendorffii]
MDRVVWVGLVAAACWIAVLKLVELVVKSWWRRRRICQVMEGQGIRGPPCNLLDGNYSEIKRMQAEAAAVDMPALTHDIVARVFPFQHKCTRLYGKHFLHWWGQDPIIHITEPELIVEVLSLKFGHWQKSSQLRRAMEFLFGKGLLVAVGEDWVRQRHAVNSALSAEKIKCFVEVVICCVKPMVRKWEQRVEEGGEAEVEVKQDMLDMATEIILRSSFGDECYDEARRYPELVYRLLGLTSKSSPFNSLIPSFVPTKKNQLLKEIEQCFYRVVATHTQQRNTILSSLLGCAARSSLSVQHVIDECKNIVFAGHETTAHMLTWTMMLLGLHPEWQQRAFEEVAEVCKGRDPTSDTLSKLRVMNMIVNESLRLYPPGAQTAREALKDMKLGDRITIPAGVSVAINIVEVHRSVEMWGDDALEFKPQRFAEGVSRACKQPVGGYLPFLLGPRVCVGQGLALMEAKLALVLILQRLSWRLSPNYRHAPIVALTLQPQHGMQLVISPRTHDR